MEKVYVVRAGRSAIGRFLGSLSGCNPVDVCAQVIRGKVEQKLLDDIDAVILGSVLTAGMGQGPARQIALAAGVPIHVPAYLVSMVCGSGMQSIRSAVNEIRCGAGAVLCGGFEFMSNAPYTAGSSMRTGTKMGDFTLRDVMQVDGLTDAMSGVHMGITAENVAEALNITREEQDDYAFESNLRAIAAVDAGFMKDEIVPVTLPRRKADPLVFSEDEYPNRSSTREKLAKLRPAFKADGTVTAGNSSGLNDGCAFLLLAGETWCRAHDISPEFEVVDTSSVGCDPQLMGLGPVDAVRSLLEKTGKQPQDIGSIELNEAFAAQALGCVKLISQQWNMKASDLLARTNLWGSGIGLGHPLGMSGARLPITLMSRMRRENTEFGLASLCVGGGQGLALLLKRN